MQLEGAAARYFQSIDAALAGLGVYLGDDASPLYGHRLTGSILTGYLERLRHTFEALRNRAAFSDRFRINQAESGYPIHQTIMDLEREKAGAAARLAALPDGDTIRADMVDFVLSKRRFPDALQAQMAERLYLEEVERGDLFTPFVMPESVRATVNDTSGRPAYVVHWGAFDGTANLPLVYTAVIEDSTERMAKLLTDGQGSIKPDLDIPFPIGGLLNPDLAHRFDAVVEANAAYSLTLTTIAANLDEEFEHLHPKQLRRIVMGPFYSTGITAHGGTVSSVLERVRNPKNAWMLTWTVQELYAISETPAKWGLFGSTPARQTYHIETGDLEATRMGVSAYERHALVPHEAYQAIYAAGKRDQIFAGYKTHVVSGGEVLRDF